MTSTQGSLIIVLVVLGITLIFAIIAAFQEMLRLREEEREKEENYRIRKEL